MPACSCQDGSRDRPLGAISPSMDTHTDWSEFYAWLLATYWEALPPEQRQETQGDVREGEVEVPEDIWRCAVMMYPEPYAWLRNPIPNLKGRTPLQVIASGQADAIRAIIQDIAGFMLPSPETVAPWSDESR